MFTVVLSCGLWVDTFRKIPKKERKEGKSNWSRFAKENVVFQTLTSVRVQSEDNIEFKYFISMLSLYKKSAMHWTRYFIRQKLSWSETFRKSYNFRFHFLKYIFHISRFKVRFKHFFSFHSNTFCILSPNVKFPKWNL